MIKAVIFDLDGLLIDSEIVCYTLYQELLKPYGFSFSVQEYTQTYSGKTAKGNMEAIINKYSLPFSISEGLEIVGQNEKNYIQKGIPLKKGVFEILDFLEKKNIQKILATSSTPERALSILSKYNIDKVFDVYTYGNEVENGKPNPDIFLKAYEKSGLPKDELIVLEDSEAGIEAAYRAGIRVINIPDMKKPTECFQKMTYKVMDSLLDVKSFLEQQD